MTRLSLIVALLWSASVGAADTQMWNEIGLGYRVTKSISLGLTGQLRFDQDLSRLADQIIDSEIQWRAARWLRLGLGYRLANEKSKKDVWRNARRPHVEVRFKYRHQSLSLGYRLRLQEKSEEKKNGEAVTASLRHRLKATYPMTPKLRPGASIELFTRFDQGMPSQLHKMRLTASLGYKLRAQHSLKSFLRLQVPIAKANDPLEQIIGLGYELTMKR
jgi:hypothetical protein